jgi:hypothetical protein
MGRECIEMKNVVKTREMELGPIRVPVMVKKNLAAELADYLMEHGRNKYDATLEQVIRLGLEASRRRTTGV